MITGIGTDMLQIARAAAALERTPKISQRILRPAEYEQFLQKTDAVRFFAKRVAAKEAIVKALGSGIGNGVGYGLILIAVAFFRELLGSGKVFGIEIFPLVTDGGWYPSNGLMLLAPSAFFLIGFFIWIIRTLRPMQVEPKE